MVGLVEKKYWLVMVVFECLSAEGLSVGNLLGIKMGVVVWKTCCEGKEGVGRIFCGGNVS